MAITLHLAKLILAEHKHRPIVGNILLVGRQTVTFSISEAWLLLEKMNIEINKNFYEKLDEDTVDGKNIGWIEDKSFFSLFTDAKVDVLDVSSYEGANILLDLQVPMPRRYERVYDFIYNGSCLDNIFNPAESIKNLSLLLKSKGRVVHYESRSNFFGSYITFSPEWFFDYYAINDFEDCKTYICTWGGNFHDGVWEIYKYSPFHNRTHDGKWLRTPKFFSEKESTVLVIAEKGENSSSDKFPLQAGYRRDDSRYLSAQIKFSKSGRDLYFYDEEILKQPAIGFLELLIKKRKKKKTLDIPGCERVGIIEV